MTIRTVRDLFGLPLLTERYVLRQRLPADFCLPESVADAIGRADRFRGGIHRMTFAIVGFESPDPWPDVFAAGLFVPYVGLFVLPRKSR